jgi:kexin
MRGINPSSLAILSLFLLAPVYSLRTPQPRSYDTHSYYALELASSSSYLSADEVAQSLGVELVEPLGELKGHWLVRSEGETRRLLGERSSGPHAVDAVLARASAIRSHKRSSASPHRIRSLTPLIPRQRAKRVPPSVPSRSRSPSPDNLFPRADETELLYAQNDLGLADPILHQQWHLINSELKDIELNVTGLWGRGITGEGIKVAIIDDGLDMESDDLKDNFVSRSLELLCPVSL